MPCKHCGIAKTAKKTRECFRCRQKLYRERNPIMATYHNHKSNAKRRGIAFELTAHEFEQIAVKYDLIVNKGTKKSSLTLDRIDATKGYTKDNIQVLLLTDNSRKGNLEKKIKYIEGSGLRSVKVDRYYPQSNEPF